MTVRMRNTMAYRGRPPTQLVPALPASLWRVCARGEVWTSSSDSARWHDGGRCILYVSFDPATAVLEALAHLSPENLQTSDFVLARIERPLRASWQHVRSAELPSGWQDVTDVTQRIGNAWFDEGLHGGLCVPSALVDAAPNALISMRHRQWRTPRIFEQPFRFDARLLHRR